MIKGDNSLSFSLFIRPQRGQTFMVTIYLYLCDPKGVEQHVTIRCLAEVCTYFKTSLLEQSNYVDFGDVTDHEMIEVLTQREKNVLLNLLFPNEVNRYECNSYK